MTKRILFGASIFFFVFVVANLAAASGLTKMDPLFRIYEQKITKDASKLKAPLNFNVSRGEVQIGALLKFNNEAVVRNYIKENGGVVQTIAGDIMVIKASFSLIEKLSQLKEVEYVEAPKPLGRKLDQAIVQTNVDDVLAGTGLSQKYDGTNIIVGVVDGGMDYSHAMFKKSDGTTRVLYYWDQAVSGAGVAEIAGSTGLECNSGEIDADTCQVTFDSGDGHGTHVTGIAAGKDSCYSGAAPHADIIFVKLSTADADSSGDFSTQVVNAASYIFQKAAALNKAAVINLSLGSSLGAHDNTSLFEQGLNNLLTGQQGRVITNAAGNENFLATDVNYGILGGIHADLTVAAGERKFTEAYFYDPSQTYGYVDIWMTIEAGKACTLEVDAHHITFATSGGIESTTKVLDWSAVSTTVSKDQDVTQTYGSEFSIEIDYQTDSINSQNSKHHPVIDIRRTSGATTLLSDYLFHVIYQGDCVVESWLYPDFTSIIDFTMGDVQLATDSDGTYVEGDSNKTITIPGTAAGVITAASYMSRKNWTDIDGTEHDQTNVADEPSSAGTLGGTQYDISLFSSMGPTADETATGVKPDIAAPGEAVVSAKSVYYAASTAVKVDDTHIKYAGTSMASPHVAGVAALLLNKNPCLTAVQVKAAITGNVISDNFTGSTLPDYQWGYGKLDAAAAINAISAADASCTLSSGGGSTTTEEEEEEICNSSGSSGCALVDEATVGTIHFWILVVTLLAVAIVRRIKIRQ